MPTAAVTIGTYAAAPLGPAGAGVHVDEPARVLRHLQLATSDQVTGQRSELIPLPPHNIMIVEGVLICKIPALGRSANLPFWVEAPLAVAAARHGARWQHEGGCPGIPAEEVRWRIVSKRTAEGPLIMAQRRRCDWGIDNAGEVRRRAFPTPAILGIP